MFKPLLRTLPTLSGNFTLSCKLNEFIKEDINEYSTYVRLGNLIPLQNFLANKNVEVNLLNGKYEHDIMKYYYHYSNVFYSNNFNFNKNNYAILDLESIYNYNNDAHNKDYEFGCKRLYYSQTGSQFNFYAPFYIDNANDLPEYFCIYLKFNDHLEKKIKIYINKSNKKNYLKNYLKTYLDKIDDRVIFCQPELLQATYFGIDVVKGGLTQYKDNLFGKLYVSQTTINNFDYTICKGFNRNNLIMRQVIPLSFSFNINDIFNNYEKNFFEGSKISVCGYYYDKYDYPIDTYDFDINYTNSYIKYKKYNEYGGNYNLHYGTDDENNVINILNVGFPALNESKYVKYEFTNKITPMYCKFKMMHSDDIDPYFININFAYSYNQYPNQKYGYFPTMFKGIFPKIVLDNGDLKLPIGTSLDNYYKVVSNKGNKIILDTTNVDKYNKLMTNYYSSWYTLNQYEPNFYDEYYISKLFNNDLYWSDVKYDYSYHKGILYDLRDLKEYNINKFGVFCNIKMTQYSNETNNLVNAKLILSKDKSSDDVYSQYYDTSFDMYYYKENSENNYIKTNYYKSIYDLKKGNINTDNIQVNKTLIKDIYGSYIEETNYSNENVYYKLDEVLDILKLKLSEMRLANEILELIQKRSFDGYILFDSDHNINFFEEIKDNVTNTFSKKIIFENLLYNKKYSNNISEWVENNLYVQNINTENNLTKYKLIDSYDKLDYNEDTHGPFFIFSKYKFISKSDIYEVFRDNKYNGKDLLEYLNSLLALQTYEYIAINEKNGIKIGNYFSKRKNINTSIYVDTYNLNNYIKQFNKFNSASIPLLKNISINNNGDDIETTDAQSNIDSEENLEEYNNYEALNTFIKFLNKNHILEYCKRFKKTEKAISENDINKLYNIFDLIYVKEHCWVIKENNIYNKDRYISLYKYLLKYIETSINYKYGSFETFINKYGHITEFKDTTENIIINNLIYLYHCSNSQILEWIDQNLSESRNSNNKFTFNLFGTNIDIDLCYNKTVVKLNNDLRKLLDSKYFLYLYILDNNIENDNSMWVVIDESELSSYNYIFKEKSNYLIPLYTDVYFNDKDNESIHKMIDIGKISKTNEYILSYDKYFKEIDVYETIVNILNKTNEFKNNWITYIKNLYTYNSTELNNINKEYLIYCTNNNLQNNSTENILTFLKDNYYDTYCLLIKNSGITLYSIDESIKINYNGLDIQNNLQYDDKFKIYRYTYNGLNYGFYWISINFNNTNRSFNILNDYDINVVFNSINNVQINSNEFNKYLLKAFHILTPFLKINIFNDFSNNIKTIVYPYESEIELNYMSSLLNDQEYKKYETLLSDNNDKLYGDIVQMTKPRKIKLLRYFNYITPYISKTNIIKDFYELKFIDGDNISKNIEKHNILSKKDIDINHYNGIEYYTGVYSNDIHKFVESTDNISNIIEPVIKYQYEYKHFNDNLLFNLPEEIIIKDDKEYTFNELEKYKSNNDEIYNKKIKILLKYFRKKGFDYSNIILFLFNKYDSNMLIETIKLRSTKKEKLYKITYKFNLI